MDAGACNALTARWLRTLPDAPTTLSAACVWPLLQLLAAASNGPARAELTAIVGPAHDVQPALPASAAVSAAVGVWSRSDLPLTDWWRDTVPASARGVLHCDGTDAATLDAWAAEQTRGLIPRMPITVTAEIRMVLASALAITTTWREPFEDVRVTPPGGPWADRELAGLTRVTDDLDTVAVADTASGPVTLVTVRGADDVDVVLCLGAPGQSAGVVLPAAVEALAPSGSTRLGSTLPLGEPGPGLRLTDVASSQSTPMLRVSTVRFTVDAEHDLLEHAELFGLRTAMDASRGHFPGISPEPLAVGQAKQAATATFTAVGFKAAAITAMAMLAGAIMPTGRQRLLQVSIDRPFGFCAVHRPTGLVLVAGWVEDPDAWVEPDWSTVTFG
jgi:hypothetical protein